MTNTCQLFISFPGRQWAATTTEGLLVYSLDSSLTFDPFDLTLDITPSFVRETLSRKEWSSALMLSFRLNETPLIQEVVESIPWKQSKLELFFLVVLTVPCTEMCSLYRNTSFDMYVYIRLYYIICI